MKAPDGHREIVAGDSRVRIDPRGAGLASFSVHGRDLVLGYLEGDPRPLYRGAILAPWPNRLADGQYEFEGKSYVVPLNEPQRGNSLHGLVDDLLFEVADHRHSRVRLIGQLSASSAYPSDIEITVDYHLQRRHLTTRVTARNCGAVAAPYGVAPHPYLRAGEGKVDDWTVCVPASHVLNVDDRRLLPEELVPLTAEDSRDLRVPARLGNRRVDHAYTGLPRAAVVTAYADDLKGVYMSWDATVLPWVQIHTADRPEPANDRVGLAVEPMTCPPNAFRSGLDLVRLRPRGRHQASWTIGAIDGDRSAVG